MTASDRSTEDKLVVDRGESKAACVDVLIAARDRADTIERAVRSALAQEEVRTVIVVDDGSTDDTAARAIRCAPDDKRVIVKRLNSGAGPSAARNFAMEISESPWIAILDSDDFFLPGRIATLLSLSADWDFVADDPLQISKDRIDQETPTSMLFGASRQPRSIDFEEFVLGNVTRRSGVGRELGFIKPLIRRSFLQRYELRYDEALRLGEDYALYARALAAGARFLLIPAAGYVSVVSADSLSAQHSRQDLERFRDTDCDLMALGSLSPKERRALAEHYSSVDCRVQWLTVIEAIKARDHLWFLVAFFRSPAVVRYVAMRLLGELRRRLRKAVASYVRAK
jgi:succinoglycan biosynthesis protein ExoU